MSTQLGEPKKLSNKTKMTGILVAMGIVYGDIGTSPMYVMRSIVESNGGLGHVSENLIIGSISLIFWTLTLLTTIKYVCIALKADNHGEGGIFALYSLIKGKGKWLIYIAMIGGAAVLADGILTPAVSVTASIEGLKNIDFFVNTFGMNQNLIVMLTVITILILFMVQRFGTELVGRFFGPIMLGWFTFLGVLGFSHFMGNMHVIKALNPYYAIKVFFLPENAKGLFILGSVFLSVTGSEALYADIGHVGKENIIRSWPYVKGCLFLNYLGQAAWILKVKDDPIFLNREFINPFFNLSPDWLMPFTVLFSVVAAIIASQALISGSYTLVAEGIKMRILPRLRVKYPTNQKGQIYIPAVNHLLMLCCILCVLIFKSADSLESAYGLSITIAMLMTTYMLVIYLKTLGFKKIVILIFGCSIGFIELVFFLTSISKIFSGAYIAVIFTSIIMLIMFVWYKGYMIGKEYTDYVLLKDYIGQLRTLKDSKDIPLYQSNIVYLIGYMDKYGHVPRTVLYSILDKRPKKGSVYWFINVFVTDEPYTQEYSIDTMGTNFVMYVQLKLGFRMKEAVNQYVRQIVADCMEKGMIEEQPQEFTTIPNRKVGDFSFVFTHRTIGLNSGLPYWKDTIIRLKLMLQRITVDPVNWFGLEYSEVIKESVPMVQTDISANRKLKEVSFESIMVEKDEQENL